MQEDMMLQAQAVPTPAVPAVEDRQVRVIRVIEMVGTREWMLQTLSSSLVSEGHEFRAFNGTIREIARAEIAD